ncbi:hypothetical protein [Brevundimonas sp. CEF1]|uniref:hypothetical protein n=1 Tax=Brevundimonas sp. CEF1 TaxID=3442642 RepID=UPI003F50F738
MPTTPLAASHIASLGFGALATTGTPAAVGTAARGTSTQSARADHVHAHGNQGGGSLHALAVSGGAAGFLSGTGAYYLSTVTASDTPNSLVWRDGGANSSFANGYAITWNIGGRQFYGDGGNFRSNVSISAPSFVPTCDLKLKADIVTVDDAEAVVRVMQIEALEYVRLEDGVTARGLGAQGLRDISPLYVVGDEPKFSYAYAERYGPCLPGEGLAPFELRAPVINPETGEQERTPLGVDPVAILADMACAVRVLMAELGAAQAAIAHLQSNQTQGDPS